MEPLTRRPATAGAARPCRRRRCARPSTATTAIPMCDRRPSMLPTTRRCGSIVEADEHDRVGHRVGERRGSPRSARRCSCARCRVGATTVVSNDIAPQAWQTSSGGCCSVAHAVHCCTASAPDVNHAAVDVVDRRAAPSRRRTASPTSRLPEQHGAARRVARTRHRQAQLDAGDLAGRLAAHLAHRLDDVAEAVDVRLAEVAAARC